MESRSHEEIMETRLKRKMIDRSCKEPVKVIRIKSMILIANKIKLY